MLGWVGISPWQPKSAPYPIKDVRISGWVGISDWQARAGGEPPMMDRSFVPGDQSLGIKGSQSEFWCIKPHHIPCWVWLLLPPLSGPENFVWERKPQISGEFRLRAQTPNKVLNCLILWLIGFYSSADFLVSPIFKEDTSNIFLKVRNQASKSIVSSCLINVLENKNKKALTWWSHATWYQGSL